MSSQSWPSLYVQVVNAKPEVASKVLETLGCTCVTGALSAATADELLKFINEESERAKADVTAGRVPFDDRFGGVNCRGMNGIFGNRQDMFLPLSAPEVRAAMEELTRRMAPFLREAIGEEGMIHELSCLVADPGSPRCSSMHGSARFLRCVVNSCGYALSVCSTSAHGQFGTQASAKMANCQSVFLAGLRMPGNASMQIRYTCRARSTQTYRWSHSTLFSLRCKMWKMAWGTLCSCRRRIRRRRTFCGIPASGKRNALLNRSLLLFPV